MASGENQGLQIALIGFVMAFIISAVLAFLFWRNYSEASLKNDSLTGELDEARKTASSAQTELNDLRERFIGIALDDFAKAEEIFQADMQKFAPTAPEAQQTYRDALNNLLTTHNQVERDLAQTRESLRDLQVAYDLAESAKTKQVETIQTQATAKENDFAGQLAEFARYKEERGAIETGLQEKLAAKDTAMKEQADGLNAQLAVRSEENQKLSEANEKLTVWKYQAETDSFEVAHGNVVMVGRGTDAGTVWINLGWDDKLQKQLVFSVHDSLANTSVGDGKKATIEVTRILDKHLAAARILEDDITDPILEGDKIYTQLWAPGRSERFAIYGDVDLDNDGKDDREALKNMITMSGGVVDAELTRDGRLEGDGMTVHTRYLITGDAPTDSQGWQDGAGTMIREADRLGIERISAEKFLDVIGFRDPQHVLRFGREGNAATYPIKEPDGGAPTAPKPEGEKFRRRRPPIQITPSY